MVVERCVFSMRCSSALDGTILDEVSPSPIFSRSAGRSPSASTSLCACWSRTLNWHRQLLKIIIALLDQLFLFHCFLIFGQCVHMSTVSNGFSLTLLPCGNVLLVFYRREILVSRWCLELQKTSCNRTLNKTQHSGILAYILIPKSLLPSFGLRCL